jgi:hypothetical protein
MSFVKESRMTAHKYLAQRLDGARDLYLLALAVGERGSGPGPLGPMIQEARIHFENVIAEARMGSPWGAGRGARPHEAPRVTPIPTPS